MTFKDSTKIKCFIFIASAFFVSLTLGQDDESKKQTTATPEQKALLENDPFIKKSIRGVTQLWKSPKVDDRICEAVPSGTARTIWSEQICAATGHRMKLASGQRIPEQRQ